MGQRSSDPECIILCKFTSSHTQATITMKFALALVALAMVAAVNARPGTEYGVDNSLIDVEAAQVAAYKMVLGGKDLEAQEKLLAGLGAGKEVVEAAAEAVTKGVDKTGYAEEAGYATATPTS